jgi:hypothetical protein
MNKSMIAAYCAFAFASPAFADASYQETTQISGGQFVDALRKLPQSLVPGSMKSLFDPVTSVVAVHGNQLASISKTSSQIIDLDQETTTYINNDKKTYYVVRFAEMREAIKSAPEKIAAAEQNMKDSGAASQTAPGGNPPPNVKVSFDVNYSDPHVSKLVNGVMAKQQFLTLKAHVTALDVPADQGPNTVTYSYVSEVWTAPKPPEMAAIDEFYGRYGAKLMKGVDVASLMKSMKPALDGTAINQLFASNPSLAGSVQDFSKKMAEEKAKITGVRILEITRLGGEAMPTASATPPAPPAAGANGSSMLSGAVTTAATDTTTSAAGNALNKLGGLGSTFGHSLMGALHRDPAPPPTAPPASGSASMAPDAVLVETTTQKSAFSQADVPPSAFQIPAGFKQVSSPFSTPPPTT